MDFSTKIIAYVILIVAVLFFGIGGTYMLGNAGQFSKHISFINATYFTIATVSTVGYGDITPITNIAKIFVVILIVTGLLIFFSAITVFSSDFVNNRVEKISGRISHVERRFLKNHVVLIGTGAVNIGIAKRLKKKNKQFIIITSDKIDADRFKDLGYRAFVAEATSEIDMSEFCLEKADSIVIDLVNSSDTVYSLLIVTSLAKGIKTVVIVQTEEVERHLHDMGLIKRENVINPNNLVARDLTSMLFS